MFSKALNYGSAVHEAFHEFYKDWKKSTLIDATIQRIDESRDKYFNLKDYTTDREKAVASLSVWYEQFGESDKETFDVVESETEHVGTLSNGLEYRIRPDRIFREKRTEKVFIVDTKTTGRGLEVMFKKTEASDQPTGYSKFIEPTYGEHFSGWITDCLYSRQSVHKCERSTPVTVDADRSLLWEVGLMSDLEDLTERYKLMRKGNSSNPSESTLPIEYLFPARKGACSAWGCPYSSICNDKLSCGINPENHGFDKDEWVENGYVDSLMEENIINLIK
jgi:hypothetical protein